ncbi:hypothetical protein GCM10010185_04460 [Saccharothrix coeruleofusca]|uniref:Uncharacterized protein n=1 Tax=Saccharothrix coeruleofusca TaxID=33919 RepID=A0A918AH99_9PSEU|nr:hypothetical protein GCM10010185_04460 [Saccharothrix coeruleofusca]
MAAPIPREPPVTRARFPANSGVPDPFSVVVMPPVLSVVYSVNPSGSFTVRRGKNGKQRRNNCGRHRGNLWRPNARFAVGERGTPKADVAFTGCRKRGRAAF